LHAALATFFAAEAAAGRITKKQIAVALEKNPAQITRWLTEPGNYEADTVSDLLLPMNAEMDYRIVPFADRVKPNDAHPLTVKIIGAPPPPKIDNVLVKTPTASTPAGKLSFVVSE